jgi:gliding motility-associated-like protein
MKIGPGKSFFLSLFFLSLMSTVFSQNCESKYLSLAYRGSTFESFSKAAFTSGNEIFVTGAMVDYNQAGHITKFSKNGIPLWSSYYIINFFDFIKNIYFSKIKFNDFILTDDGGVIVAGQVEQYRSKQWALMAKISKYGIVEWNKTYTSATGLGNLSFNNIYKTADGDIIAYMSNDMGASIYFPVYSYNRVIRYSASGELKWATSLLSGAFDAAGNGVEFKRGIAQLAGKNIVVGDVVCKSDKNTPFFKINDGRLHFYSLDYNTGKIEWESDYRYSFPVNDSSFIPKIEFVSELPSGKLAFTTSLYLTTAAEPVLKKKPVTIITDNKGVPQKLISFYSPGNSCELVDVAAGNVSSNKNFLFQVNGSPVISLVSNEETVTWSKGYTSVYPPNCFAAGTRGYGILLSNNNSHQFKLQLTGANGKADCVETTAEILTETIIPFTSNADPVITAEQIYTPANYRDYFLDYGYPLIKKAEYPLSQTTECEEQLECCKDFVDSLHINKVRLCEGASYTLPGNNIIKDSGTYYVVNKTAAGCDSVTYYRVNIDKNLSALTLGNDTCLTGKDSVVLKATEGYTGYNWIGSAATSSASYIVYRPGMYRVTVTNICGSKTDYVEIYDQCDFPVYIPDAFTPNGDNLNDSFGIPEQNKNRLIDFKIYNRWGQIVFQTNKASKKWDGKFKNQILASDVFVYYLKMEGLSGNRITHKGKVMLIR